METLRTALARLQFSEEPVVWVAAVNALIVLAIAFGVPISNDQKIAIGGVITTLSAFFLRSQVFPAAHVDPAAPEEPKP